MKLTKLIIEAQAALIQHGDMDVLLESTQAEALADRCEAFRVNFTGADEWLFSVMSAAARDGEKEN